MLIKIVIKNYILIDFLEIDFDEGLNVLTGETGAGKSIILGAIRLALGERLNGDVIRSGRQKAVIQAVFNCPSNAPLNEWCDEEGLIIFKREIFSSGRSLIKINDEVSTLNQARQIAGQLLSIHGQNDYQALLDSRGQLSLINAFLDEKGQRNRAQLAALYTEINAIDNKLTQMISEPAVIARELELIEFQMKDIDEVALTDDDDMLEQRFLSLNKAEHFLRLLQENQLLIDGEDSAQTGIANLLNQLMQNLTELTHIQPEISEQINVLNDFSFALAELSSQMQQLGESLQFDHASLQTIENRLDKVNRLKSKYGKTVQAILDYRDNLDIKQQELTQSKRRQQQLNELKRDYLARYHRQNKALRDSRELAISRFKQALTHSLCALNFDHVSLNFTRSEIDKLTVEGSDRYEIMISLNKGQAVQALSKVASGGEVSRIMLAVKEVLSEKDQVGVLIFDEIDNGISGVTASVVADKLYGVARHHQVICITHLAQLSLLADRHFAIVKDSSGQTAISRVVPLTTEQRIDEIARIIGGAQRDASIRAQAEKLLARAARFKQSQEEEK